MLGKRALALMIAVSMVLGLSGLAVANESTSNWWVEGTWTGWSYIPSYTFVLDITDQDCEGNIQGHMSYPSLGIEATVSGLVSGDQITFTRDDIGKTYTAELVGNIDATSMIGTFEDSNGTTGAWEAYGTAIGPVEIEVTGQHFHPTNEVVLEATVAGSTVEGLNVDFYLDGSLLGIASTNSDGVATLSVPSISAGTYGVMAKLNDCVFATADVSVFDVRLSGGGQILHRPEGSNEQYKISFGGAAYRLGPNGLEGDWTVQFHNVGLEAVDKGRFHAYSVLAMDPNFLPGIANFELMGTFNGEPGYTLMVRFEDAGEPGSQDTVRFELSRGSVRVYDSLDDFPGNSSRNGTARTYLDRGNLQKVDLR